MANPIKLNLWVMPNAGFDTQRIMQKELAHFRRENPGYDVKLTVHPWHFAWDRLIAVAKHKDYFEPPDVVQIGGTWNTTLAALGALSDLTDYLDDIETYGHRPPHLELLLRAYPHESVFPAVVPGRPRPVLPAGHPVQAESFGGGLRDLERVSRRLPSGCTIRTWGRRSMRSRSRAKKKAFSSTIWRLDLGRGRQLLELGQALRLISRSRPRSKGSISTSG